MRKDTPLSLISDALRAAKVTVQFEFVPLSRSPHADDVTESGHQAMSFNWQVRLQRARLVETFPYSASFRNSPFLTMAEPRCWPYGAGPWPWTPLRMEAETGHRVAYLGNGRLAATDKAIRPRTGKAIASIYGKGMAYECADAAEWFARFGIDPFAPWADDAHREAVELGRRFHAFLGDECYRRIAEASRLLWAAEDRSLEAGKRRREHRRAAAMG